MQMFLNFRLQKDPWQIYLYFHFFSNFQLPTCKVIHEQKIGQGNFRRHEKIFEL